MNFFDEYNLNDLNDTEYIPAVCVFSDKISYDRIWNIL